MSDKVAERIRSQRKARGWTPADLAERCGGQVSENSIENIESGRRVNGRRRRSVTVDEVYVLARALDVAPAQLLPGGPLPNLTPQGFQRLADAALKAKAEMEAMQGAWWEGAPGGDGA